MSDIKQIYKTILKHIDEASHVMLVMHRKPDGDTAGSALALANYLDTLEKPHTCFCIDELSPAFKYLPGYHKVTTDGAHWSPDQAKFDLVIVLDSGDLSFNGIADYVEQLTHDYKIINIDHHATNADYGHVNLVIRDASSTCEIVHDLLDHAGGLNKETATCLLTGLMTDTGGLSNLATTASSIHTASKLLQRGANLKRINDNTMQNRKMASLKLWGRALERLHLNDAGLAITCITQKDIEECGADDEAVEGISNFLNSLDQETESRAVLVLAQRTPGEIKGSLRSTHPLIDVSKIATLLGGGGHIKAAGFTVEGTLIERDGQWTVEKTNNESTWTTLTQLQEVLEGQTLPATT